MYRLLKKIAERKSRKNCYADLNVALRRMPKIYIYIYLSYSMREMGVRGSLFDILLSFLEPIKPFSFLKLHY